MGDIIIRYVNMPLSAKAFTATDENGDYNIYVNTRYNSLVQQQALDHELQHIDNDHFYRSSPVALDEKEACVPKQSAIKVTPVPLPNAEKSSRPVHPIFYPLRQKSGLAAFQVAKLAGIRPSTYTQYELGIRSCPPQDERAILNILNKFI